MSSVAGFLCLSGQEVVNEERTRAYLRNCLGDSSWQFFDCDCPPLAAHIVEGGCSLVLNGTTGTNVSTPHDPKFNLPDGGSVRVVLAFDDWDNTTFPGFPAKRNGAEGWGLNWRGNLTPKRPGVSFGTDVTTDQGAAFDAIRPADGDYLVYRADFDPDNGANRVVDFFNRPLDSSPLDLLLSDMGWTNHFTGTGAVTTLPANTNPVHFGRLGGIPYSPFRVRAAVIKDDAGTVLASPDFTKLAPGTTSFTDAQGNVWTLNGNAEIACTLDAYGSPATDPAPWYSAAHPASEKFFGFIPDRSELSVPTSRAVTQRIDGGGVLGPELMLPRNVEFRGWLVAADEEGMRWGIRWMQEVLRGRICAPGCSPGDLSLLTSCADPSYFREMVGAGLVDGPRFDVAVPDNHESVAVPTQFQLAVEMPYLYHDPSEVVSGEVADGTSECAFFTTEEWFDGADLQIEISSEANASDLTLTMAVSLDGTCDEMAQPCARITIPLLPAEGKLTIDGRRRQVRFFNPTRRTEEAGYRVVDWIGAFPYFDVAACAQMCICLDNAGSEPVSWTVTKWEREL